MKLYLMGDGGEFCVGKINETQTKFIFENAKEDESGEYHVNMEESEFWEGDIIAKPWNDLDDITHSNSAYGDNWWISNENGDLITSVEKNNTGTFEIDLENDERFDLFEDNTKLIIGWNRINAPFEKGFHSLKSKDFSENTIKHFKCEGEMWSEKDNTPCLVGTQSYERGEFYEFEVPDDFDIKKLILIIVKFHFVEDDYVSCVSNIIYDGLELEMEFIGDTRQKDLLHFVLECNYDQDDPKNVDFDWSLEFRTN